MPDRPVRVFISYTHDTNSHKRRVMNLARQLRDDGVDARMDRFVTGTPPGGWPAWMEEELAGADFIVLICTASYNERFRQRGDPSVGLGSRWESSLVRDLLYSGPQNIGRFVPVLPRTSSVEDIPLPLRFRASHYRLGDHEGLLTYLRTGPRRRGGGATEEESSRFSSTIRDQLQRINQRVEDLTEEQYAVIAELHGRPRALISGTPGSGKTLVAAEKAIRLAHAGVKTLFLSHNPLLAEWVSELTASASVDVRAFEDLIADLVRGSEATPGDWTNYSEPSGEQLESALKALEGSSPPYQAVIVDEGQDFADEWWPVVEALLPPTREAILYVFFDERQSLLPYRSKLPPSGWPLTLSRNCRNAGRVYEVMRRLAPGSPLPDEELRHLGHAEYFRAARLGDAVIEALRMFDEFDAINDLAAILGGGVDFQRSVLAKGRFPYREEVQWQGLVRKEIRKLAKYWSQMLRAKEIDPETVWRLDQLSEGSEPSAADIAAVEAAASRIASVLPAKLATFHRPQVNWRPTPVSSTGAVNWRLHSTKKRTRRLEALNAFRCKEWTRTLPEPPGVEFAPRRECEPGKVPVYSIGEIKGLERNAVLLVMQGDAPQFMHHLFVGVSRPRTLLAVVGDARTQAALPSNLEWPSRP